MKESRAPEPRNPGNTPATCQVTPNCRLRVEAPLQFCPAHAAFKNILGLLSNQRRDTKTLDFCLFFNHGPALRGSHPPGADCGPLLLPGCWNVVLAPSSMSTACPAPTDVSGCNSWSGIYLTPRAGHSLRAGSGCSWHDLTCSSQHS